eukprot:9501375-Pyramimonas_sp.AAC.2
MKQLGIPANLRLHKQYKHIMTLHGVDHARHIRLKTHLEDASLPSRRFGRLIDDIGINNHISLSQGGPRGLRS